MMQSPGRPADPTTHPRTRPEAEDNAIKMRGTGDWFRTRPQAEDNAIKMRGTGDWFRHDGKNVEEPEVPVPRLQGHVAPEVAEKNKGEPDKWFQQDPKNPGTPKAAPVPRCPTDESKVCKDKIYGKEESWFKMEDNKDYHTPRPKSRMTSAQGQEVLEKLGHADTMDWFKHSHAEGEEYTPPPPKSRTGPMPYATENQEKMRPQEAKQPDWAAHHTKNEESQGQEPQPVSRVNTADARENLDKNKGSADNWFGDSGKNTGTPKVNSKSSAESEQWFSHEATNGRTPQQPQPRAMTDSARNMVEKSRGNEMSGIMGGSGADSSQDGAPARVKPEAQEIAKKSMEGIMSKYMNQDGNRDYQSARPGGRVVKPEAQEAAARNQGSMSDSLQGHPMGGGPRKCNNSRVVKSEAATNAERNKGSMGSIFGGGDMSERSPAPKTRGFADKHQGQGMSGIMGGVGSMDMSDRQQRGGGNASARAAAERNRGTVGDLFK